MVIVAGTAPIHPERREEALHLAQRMAELTAAEAGCVSYRFYADPDDPAALFIFEEWENEEALAHHFQTEHMAWFQAQMPPFLAGPLRIKRYDVERVIAM